jgi:hypothetical protein
MTLLDVREFIEASLTQLGAVDLNIANFQAGKFGVADGFRFDVQFAYKTGLIAKGFVVGTISGDRLVGMMFTAAETYYYARDLPEAERIVASIEFGGTVASAETSLARKPVPVATIVANPGPLANPALYAKPMPVVVAPAPQTGQQPAPASASAQPAFVTAPIAPTALPLCSTLPYEQPPGTRNINETMRAATALLPIAAPVRVNRPCIPDPPGGTTARDVAQSKDNLRPVTAVP